MAQGEKVKIQSSNQVESENDDKNVKSGFVDARGVPVSITPTKSSSIKITKRITGANGNITA